jgi:hypothetical protein
MPLLANLCSEECKNALPQPPENYIQHAHKGSSLQQPSDENERFEQQLKAYKLKKIRLKLCRKGSPDERNKYR